MASTFTSLLVHFVFSTKNRQPLIRPEIETSLYNYIAGIMSNRESRLLVAGGRPDHLHLLGSLAKKENVVDLMEVVKRDSSRWIKTQGPEFADFYWQDGYGAFSIGQSSAASLKAYIADQKKHHQGMTFQEEFLKFLAKYDIPYDPRYIWK